MALDTSWTGMRPSGDGPRCPANRDATPPGGSFGSREASWWSTGRVVRRFFARFPPSRRLGASFQSKAPGQLKASWIILRNGSAQLVQLTTKWQGLGVWWGCGRGQGDSSHLGVPSSGMAFLPASMRSQHLLRWNLNLHLWIPRFIPVTIKKPNRTGAIRQKGIRLLSEGELCHRYQHLACKVAS